MKALRLAVNTLSVILMAAALLVLLGSTLLPTLLGYKSYVVLSGSMSPAIKTGAVVMAVPVAPSTLRVGDVIVYNRSDIQESITHRIIKVNGPSDHPTFVTKGDANGAPDDWTVKYAGATAGKVVLAVPYVGYVYHALGSPQGRLIFLAVPVVVLALMWLWQIWRPDATIDRKETELPRGLAPAIDLTPAKLAPHDPELALITPTDSGSSVSLRQ